MVVLFWHRLSGKNPIFDTCSFKACLLGICLEVRNLPRSQAPMNQVFAACPTLPRKITQKLFLRIFLKHPFNELEWKRTPNHIAIFSFEHVVLLFFLVCFSKVPSPMDHSWISRSSSRNHELVTTQRSWRWGWWRLMKRLRLSWWTRWWFQRSF